MMMGLHQIRNFWHAHRGLNRVRGLDRLLASGGITFYRQVINGLGYRSGWPG
jgi:hypothetical protein